MKYNNDIYVADVYSTKLTADLFYIIIYRFTFHLQAIKQFSVHFKIKFQYHHILTTIMLWNYHNFLPTYRANWKQNIRSISVQTYDAVWQSRWYVTLTLELYLWECHYLAEMLKYLCLDNTATDLSELLKIWSLQVLGRYHGTLIELHSDMMNYSRAI